MFLKYGTSGGTEIRDRGECSKKSVQQGRSPWTSGAYPRYVSTEKWRERRWRFFSTTPTEKEASLRKGFRITPERIKKPIL
jgi:hypothetical protein